MKTTRDSHITTSPLLQTKKLWIDRLQRGKKYVENSQQPVPFAKPPRKLSISYSFSSSPLLQEQVSYYHAWSDYLMQHPDYVPYHDR